MISDLTTSIQKYHNIVFWTKLNLFLFVCARGLLIFFLQLQSKFILKRMKKRMIISSHKMSENVPRNLLSIVLSFSVNYIIISLDFCKNANMSYST